MTQYLIKKERLDDVRPMPKWPFVLIICVVLGVVAYWVWLYSQRAPTARMAMALGQFSRAHDLYLEEANLGNPSAQNALGNLYYLGLGVSISYPSARDWYYKSAKKGFADAHLNLGHLYKQGLGVERDPVRAFGWYNMAHKYGNLAAEYYLSQITVEWTLSPLMIDAAQKKWSKLDALLDETL